MRLQEEKYPATSSPAGWEKVICVGVDLSMWKVQPMTGAETFQI